MIIDAWTDKISKVSKNKTHVFYKIEISFDSYDLQVLSKFDDVYNLFISSFMQCEWRLQNLRLCQVGPIKNKVNIYT